jgi:UDP:flavonoid glycosyltransferase YjiC (YdhE family)
MAKHDVPSARMSRVVMFPFAPGDGLAHVGACLAVGAELRRRGHTVVVAYGGSAPEVVHAAELPLARVGEVPLERTGSRTAAQWFTGPNELIELVEQDQAVLRSTHAEVAVVDVRPSARLACLLLGVPHVSLIHFLAGTHWADEPDRWARRLRAARSLGRALRAVQFRFSRDPFGSHALRAVFDAAGARLGLSGTPAMWDGTLVACTTTPLLDPVHSMPAHWRYVGPVTWSAVGDGEPPTHGQRPTVYVTQGSTGSAATLRRAVVELAHEPVDLLVTTAGLCDPDQLRALVPSARVERLLPGRLCMQVSDAAVIHGGHLTASEAHAAGTPVVVIPHQLDHWMWERRVERLGTGIALRPPLLPGAIRRAVRRLLSNSRYAMSAKAVAAHLRTWNGPAATAILVESLLE